jgi:hypothetical protein
MKNVTYFDVNAYCGEKNSATSAYNYATQHIMVGFESSLIDYMTFSTSSFLPFSELGVRFHNNSKVYTYTNVPSHVFNKLVNADSVGKAFNELVKDKYQFRTFDLAEVQSA